MDLWVVNDTIRRSKMRDVFAGNEPDAKYNTLAGMIVNNLAAPDIVGLEEIQDNNGATNDSIVDANVTLARISHRSYGRRPCLVA